MFTDIHRGSSAQSAGTPCCAEDATVDRTRSPEREERLVLTLVGKTFAICYTQYCQGKREDVTLKSNPREDDKREIGMIQDCV